MNYYRLQQGFAGPEIAVHADSLPEARQLAAKALGLAYTTHDNTLYVKHVGVGPNMEKMRKTAAANARAELKALEQLNAERAKLGLKPKKRLNG